MSQASVTLKERILQTLRDCISILSGFEHSSLYTEVVNSIDRLQHPMQLAIIGKISSSKSTLVNALLGEAEIVRTGQMEETFNVSWLKFGASDSDIKVFFKDGTVTNVPRKDWSKWTSHQEKNSLKEKVKYIEVYYEHDILKDINIIDTPGLDALSQIDSKNTISFLQEVRPDAVVMLFTKSIAESTLSVLQDFQNNGTTDFNLSALNAIGVLAKVDTIWSAMEADKDVIVTGQRVIKSTLYDKYPEVRKSLFSILPVSSLMGLASSTINIRDVESIRDLSYTDDGLLLEMLSSPEFFSDSDYKVTVPELERQRLYEKFGLYGIYVLIDAIRNNRDASLGYLSNVLKDKSGFGKLLLTTQSHFGGRSTLIKSQAILQKLLFEINRAKSTCNGDEYNAIAKVENTIVATLLSLHEYKEWELLSKYYDGKLDLPDSVANEFIALCGEKGYSICDKLQCSEARDFNHLIDIATKRALYWQKQYNIYSVIEPELAALYKVIISSYNLLLMNLKSAISDYEKAKETIARTSLFIGLNQSNTELA